MRRAFCALFLMFSFFANLRNSIHVFFGPALILSILFIQIQWHVRTHCFPIFVFRCSFARRDIFPLVSQAVAFLRFPIFLHRLVRGDILVGFGFS